MIFSRFTRARWILAVGGMALCAGPVSAQTTTTTTTTTAPPLRPDFGGPSGRAIVSQLAGPSPTRKIPARKNLTARQRALQAKRVANMTPAQRKKAVLEKYDIPPAGWLAAYLPADRYKFGKVWQYVSTETDRYYYRPQDMPRKKFNANRVIGFRTWQLAMLAGYRPDPVTKPAPGAQILALSRYTRGPNFYRFVEYTYSGQVSPERFASTYDYARRVTTALNSSANGRRYLGNTLDRVFQAVVENNPNLIPRTVGGPPPAPATTTNTAAEPGAAPSFPAAGNVTAPPANSSSANSTNGADDTANGGDKRTNEFNGFSQRAGNLARRPAPPL